MREFKTLANGVTIVDFGLSLTVADGKAIVHYEGAQADYFSVLNDGKLSDSLGYVTLQEEQMNWLKDQQAWVESHIGLAQA